MDRDQWQRIRALFEETVRQPSQDQERFLEEACSEDPSLIPHVKQLLQAERDSKDFLEPPADEGVARLVDESPSQTVTATTIGSYEIRRLVASGGMGRVYEAEQKNPQRVVALKMLRHQLATPAALRRFRHESELLARLKHPAIAQIFEAGTHFEGDGPTRHELPFFAMEYVEGAQDVVGYANDRGLSIEDRLRLFILICEGVHHGHQRGVIHRDLKPANLLIDAAGRPKIIDFGVARVIDAEQATDTRLTEAGQIMGTMHYMSPEQIEADANEVDTRSDIYSLGVCLYELLTGYLPFEIDQAPMHKAARIITETEPIKPGRRVRSLIGDLERIILKAMHRDRDQRYAAVSDLSGDLRRFLAHEPVLAGPPGTAYRMKKFIRKYRVGVTAAVLVVLALLCGMTGIVLGLIEAREQHRIAELEKEKAIEAQKEAEAQRDVARKEVLKSHTVIDFLKEMFACASPWQDGRDVKVVDILDRAAARIETALEHEPEVEAMLRFEVGRVYYRLGLLDEALPHIEYAMVGLSSILGEASEEAIGARNLLTLLLERKGLLERAERHARETLQISRKFFNEDHQSTLGSMNNLAIVLQMRACYEEAGELHRAVLEKRISRHGENHLLTAYSMNNLANVLQDMDRPEDAVELYRKAFEVRETHLGLDHPDTVTAQSNLATTMMTLGRTQDAEPLLRKVHAVRLRELGEDHPSTLEALQNLGVLEANLGHFPEGEKILREVTERMIRVFGEENLNTLDSMHQHGNVLLQMERFEEAEALVERTLDGLIDQLGEDHPKTLDSKRCMARLQLRLGRYVVAEEQMRALLQDSSRIFGPDHTDTLIDMNNLSTLLIMQKRNTEAEPFMRMAVEGYRRIHGDEHMPTLLIRNNFAALLLDIDREDEAEAVSRDVIEIASKILPAGNLYIDVFTIGHGVALTRLGRLEEAEEKLLRCLENLKAGLGEGHMWTQAVIRNLAKLYRAWEKPEKEEFYQAMLPESEGFKE